MDNEEIKDAIQSEEENKDIDTAADAEEVNNEENIDEVVENEFLLKEEENKKHSIVNDVLGTIMDQLAMLCVSALILLVFGYIIKFVGYYVVMPIPVLLIIYFIVGCLYAPILRHSRLKKTIGEKITKIQ